MVIFEIKEGKLSGSITFTIICKGLAPILCAISIILGSTSLRLLSTNLATNGKAAITKGTIDATVPTTVPTISRVSGKTIIIRIRNGTERSKLIIRFRAQMAIEKNIAANILAASTRSLGGKAYGNMLLSIKGNEDMIQEAIQYLSKIPNIIVEEAK
jgi:ABC-type methionine transport system ATPase subunit